MALRIVTSVAGAGVRHTGPSSAAVVPRVAARVGRRAKKRRTGWQRVTRALHRHPMASATVSLAARYGLGDVLTQTVFEGGNNEPIDLRRLAAFTTFGAAYGGLIAHVVYNVVYPRFRLLAGASRALFLSVVDVTVQCPLLYYPAFYFTLEVVNNPSTIPTMLHAALSKYSQTYVADIKMLAAVWIPLHAFNFGVVPAHMRVPFIATAGLLWAVVLSKARGRYEPAPARASVSVAADSHAPVVSTLAAAALPTPAPGAASPSSMPLCSVAADSGLGLPSSSTSTAAVVVVSSSPATTPAMPPATSPVPLANGPRQGLATILSPPPAGATVHHQVCSQRHTE